MPELTTKRLITDDTGQEIVGALESIASAMAPDVKLSDEYSDTATYAIGDYCIHDNRIYRCTTAITTAEAWNATKWQITTIAEELQRYADLIPYTTIAFPSAGSSASYNVPGMVGGENGHRVKSWNMVDSSSNTIAENDPPVSLSITTYDGYFTIYNTGSTTPTGSLRPIFSLPLPVTISNHT